MFIYPVLLTFTMNNGKKVGLLLTIIAALYFIWIIGVALHEGGFLLKDTDFFLSLWEWAAIGIVLYLLFILVLLLFFFLRPKHELHKEEFTLAKGRKNWVVCSYCKTPFSIPDTGKRPLEITCPHCYKQGILTGKKMTGRRKNVSCANCGNSFEFFDDGTGPLECECPECHHQESIP